MSKPLPPFLREMLPHAVAANAKSGIPASVSLAQAVLESGWGKSGLARYKNLFGIKAGPGWQGETVLLPTREFRKGQWAVETARWRVYPSYEAAFLDHARLFYNGRYEAALAWRKNPKEFLQRIAPVYATDPRYAEKVWGLIETYGLTRYDVKPEGWRLEASLVPTRWRGEA